MPITILIQTNAGLHGVSRNTGKLSVSVFVVFIMYYVWLFGLDGFTYEQR